jgi:signal transduction histidine kinase
LARVRRQLHEPTAALHAYDQLEPLEAFVSGLPAGLIARVGRAGVFADAKRTSELKQEASRLAADLQAGRWRVLKSTYSYYLDQARSWGAVVPADDGALQARTAAVEWLWSRRGSDDSGQRLLVLDGAPLYVTWRTRAARIEAAILGPGGIRAFAQRATGDGHRWALTDLEGRIVPGDLPPDTLPAVRTPATTALPWGLHLYHGPASTPPFSPRTVLLVLVLVLVAFVLFAGSYFVVRAVNREVRVGQLQTDFVAAVSHEFRSPLTSLAHVSDLLAEDRLPTESARRQSYRILVRDTDRLRRLVEGLLDFGRLGTDGTGFRFEPSDLAALVHATVAEFRGRHADDDIIVELTAPARVIDVSVDREAYSRALWNLLDNAVKYSPGCQTIWVDVSQTPDGTVVSVRDQGIGIPDSERDAIFERFVRGAESKARRIRGTGIGLAMVRQILRAHGGDVHVESEPGVGSTFRMLLPRSEIGAAAVGCGDAPRTEERSA